MAGHDYIVARIEIGGNRFEVLVDPDLAFRYKSGEKVNLNDMVVSDFVYKDARKGLKASPESLRRAFGTEDVKQIAETIVKKGELQLTSMQRKQLLEAKKRQIINYIAKNAVDPKTKMPIPVKRLENLFEQLRISVNINKSAETQAIDAVKKIARVIPIKIARAVMKITVPPEYSGRIYSELSRLGELKKSDWKTDGSLVAEIEIPAGAQNEVINSINKMTKGRAEIQIKVVD